MMSINPPQSFDWTVRSLYKALNESLEEGNLFLELQKFEGDGKDYAAKTVNVVKKKNLFIYLLGRKGQQIFQFDRQEHEKEKPLKILKKEHSKWLLKYSKITANL